MSTLEFIQNRKSTPAKCLTEPAPTQEELEQIILAALSAPDHGVLQPWEFIIIEGESRKRLGDSLVKANLARNPSLTKEDADRQRGKPLRSPIIIAVIAKITENYAKVPEFEQLLSAGAAATHILLASQALGYDGVWLSGPNSLEPCLKQDLGIAKKDTIIGFIYLGTSSLKHNKRKLIDPKAFIRYWP